MCLGELMRSKYTVDSQLLPGGPLCCQLFPRPAHLWELCGFYHLH